MSYKAVDKYRETVTKKKNELENRTLKLNRFSRFFHDFFRENRKYQIFAVSIKSTLFEQEKKL